MKRQFIFIVSDEAKNVMSIQNFVETVKLRAVGVKGQEIGPENLTEEIVKDICVECEKAIDEKIKNYVPAFTKDNHHYISLDIEIH